MYLHIGIDKVINTDDILGIFDLDNTTVQKSSKEFLANAEKAGEVENVCTDLPKSFVVCLENGRRKVYITQIASSTIIKRMREKYETLS
ncbi:MAG: DUF370 domain-containing protein [Clostridia bacterium]|nr:DUF370 domain-containing protein [Clostridia bacterium]MBR4451046.1 DUF370 domain-containing protein [Clostridia bacterium]